MDGHHLSKHGKFEKKNTKYDSHDEVRPKTYFTIGP